MPITPTEKIWMNGELVAVGRRPDPRAHPHAALRHGRVRGHPRLRDRPTGPAVFRLTDHIERLFNSAQHHDDGHPVHGRRAREGREGHGARRPACRRATSGRSRTTATARWGSTRCRARSTCRSRAGRGAPTSATTRVSKGVRMKISSWTRHDHNTMPPRGEDHRQLRQLVAGQGRGAEGRLRRGDHAQPARARVASAPARTSSSARDGVLITPPLSAGALEGITQDSVTTIARDHGFEVRGRRPARAATCTSPTRCSCAAPRPRSSAVDSVDDRAIPCPGPMTAGHRRGVRSRPCAARSTATRTGVELCQLTVTAPDGRRRGRDLRHDAARRRPARGHLAHRRGQAAHRRAARLARRATTSRRGWPGANPKDDEFFRRAPDRAAARPRRRSSRSARPGASRARSTPTTRCATSWRPRRRHGVHRRQGVGLPRARGAAAPRSTRARRWSPTRSSSCAARAATCSSTPSTSSTATSATPSSRCGCSRPRRPRARRTWCCATPTAARCRTRSSASSREVVDLPRRRRRHRGAPPRRRRHRRGQRARRRAGRRDARCRARSTATASAPATATSPTIIPNLTLKMGIETIPADRLERLTPVAHHVAELVNMPLNPQAAYVGHSAFAHKAGLHMSAIAKRPDAYEHCRPTSVGNGTRFVVSELGGQVDARAEGEGARPRARRSAARRGGRAAQAARARGLPLRGRRRLARAAHAARDRVGARLVPGRVVPGDHRRPHRHRDAHRRDRRDGHDRGHGQGATSTASA